MPRARLPENKPLPRRWRARKRAGGVSYYYQVPPGMEHAWGGKQTFLLGHNLADALLVRALGLPSEFTHELERFCEDVTRARTLPGTER